MSLIKTVAFAIACLMLSSPLVPSRVLAADKVPGAGATPSSGKREMLFWIEDAEKKLTELAEATPEAKYSFRPAKDVRSTGEVFMHAAGANFGIPSFFGVKPPEGFDIKTYEKSLRKKADIIKALKASFAHVKTALEGAADADFDKPVEMFGMKTTVRGAYLLVLAHGHEHLGQSIAYARSNGIAAPWTERRKKAADATAK